MITILRVVSWMRKPVEMNMQYLRNLTQKKYKELILGQLKWEAENEFNR